LRNALATKALAGELQRLKRSRDGTLAIADVITVRPEDSSSTVLHIMVDERIEHVPVVDDDGTLVGICTRTDLLKVRRRHADLERRQTGVQPRRLRLPKRPRPSIPTREETNP